MRVILFSLCSIKKETKILWFLHPLGENVVIFRFQNSTVVRTLGQNFRFLSLSLSHDELCQNTELEVAQRGVTWWMYPHQHFICLSTTSLWARSTKNTDWSTGPLARPFARTAHSFACSALLASLACSAALTRSLARSLCSPPRSWDSEWSNGYLFCVFFYSCL